MLTPILVLDQSAYDLVDSTVRPIPFVYTFEYSSLQLKDILPHHRQHQFDLFLHHPFLSRTYLLPYSEGYLGHTDIINLDPSILNSRYHFDLGDCMMSDQQSWLLGVSYKSLKRHYHDAALKSFETSYLEVAYRKEEQSLSLSQVEFQ